MIVNCWAQQKGMPSLSRALPWKVYANSLVSHCNTVLLQLAASLFPGCAGHLLIIVTNLQRKQFKGGMLSFGLWFQKFKSMACGLCYFKLHVNLNLVAVWACNTWSDHYRVARKERDRARRLLGQIVLFKGTLLATSLLHQILCSILSVTIYTQFNYEPINGLILWVGQNTHSSIGSPKSYLCTLSLRDQAIILWAFRIYFISKAEHKLTSSASVSLLYSFSVAPLAHSCIS